MIAFLQISLGSMNCFTVVEQRSIPKEPRDVTNLNRNMKLQHAFSERLEFEKTSPSIEASARFERGIADLHTHGHIHAT